MPEQSRHLSHPKPSRRGALDEREERPQFLFRGDERLEARPKPNRLPADEKRRLAPGGIGGRAHSGTTAPELSRLRA